MKQYMTKLEWLALLVGCLCHDVDHRGTNNAFQEKYVLFVLYSYRRTFSFGICNPMRLNPVLKNVVWNTRGSDPESRRLDPESRRSDLESRRSDLESRRLDLESRRLDLESRRSDPESRISDPESRAWNKKFKKWNLQCRKRNGTTCCKYHTILLNFHYCWNKLAVKLLTFIGSVVKELICDEFVWIVCNCFVWKNSVKWYCHWGQVQSEYRLF